MANEMEFRLINPKAGGFLTHIEWNRDELEEAVKAKVAEYSNIAYTDETMKMAKEDLAKLRKLKDAIETQRKQVKEVINRPYVQFESELKGVTAIIDEQIDTIDHQVKEYETELKDAKKKKLHDAYKKTIGDLADVLPFERFFDQRYLNKTVKTDRAISDIEGKIEKAKADMLMIENTCGKYALNAKDVYARTLDLSSALAEEQRLKDLEEKFEADRIRKEKEEEERRKAEEARRKEEEERDRKCTVDPVPVENVPDKADEENHAESQNNGTQQTPTAEKTAKYVKAKFYAIGTMDQIRGLIDYMNANGIRYGKVE